MGLVLGVKNVLIKTIEDIVKDVTHEIREQLQGISREYLKK